MKIITEKINDIEVEKIKVNLTSQKKQIADLNNKIEYLKISNKQLNDLNKELIKEKKNLVNSASYKIGFQLSKDIRRPLHWPLLPIKLYRILRQRIKKKNAKIAQSQYLQKVIFEQLHIAKKTNAERLLPVNGCICYVLHNSLPYSSGGYATRSHNVALSLNKKGYDIKVLTRTGFPLDVKDSKIDEINDSTIDGIKYYRIGSPIIKGNSLSSYMSESIYKYNKFFQLHRPAYVVCASSFRHSLSAIIAAKQLGIPTIYEVRGFWEITRISREPSYALTTSFEKERKMETETCRAADHVFTLTNAMKNELIERGVKRSSISLTPNACDPELFKPMPPDLDLLKKFEIPDNVPVIGFIGSWVHYEGLDDLLNACKIIFERGIEFRCILVGSENVTTGQDKNKKGLIYSNLQNILSNHALADWVLMPGRVPYEDVSKFYSIVDIAVYPRKPVPVCEMVSPIKPLEAMAMEKAVLVSSVSALAEMVETDKTGIIFKKGDIGSLADKLEILLGDKVLRQKLGKNARNEIIGTRNWTSIANSFEKQLNQIEEIHQSKKTRAANIRNFINTNEFPVWYKELSEEFRSKSNYVSLERWQQSLNIKKLTSMYKKKFGTSNVNKRIPRYNWIRADLCAHIAPDNSSIIDIGSGLGEFVNLLALNNLNADITSVDLKDYDLWHDFSSKIKRVYKDIFSLNESHKREVVTCFEVIEHLPPKKIEEAINILRNIAQKKLFISVPFMEPLPLFRGHFTRFTEANLLKLLPDAKFTVFDRNTSDTKNVLSWILAEIDV